VTDAARRPDEPPPEPGTAHQRPDPPAAAPPPEEAGLAQQLADTEDRFKRALADLDNYRKRAGREIERRLQEDREQRLRDWLEAVDSVERALAMQPENPLSEGLRAVLEQMESILARQGVRRIGAAGEEFDPERMEAIGVRAGDGVPDRTVLDVARSGYAIGDRVLRPAQVVVARAPQRQA
jgi:molecular chaperone GrpE